MNDQSTTTTTHWASANYWITSVDRKWKTVDNGKLKEPKEKPAPPPPPGPPPNLAAPIVLLERTILGPDPSPTPNCSKGKNTGGKGRKDPPDPDIMPPVGVIKGLGLAMHNRARFDAVPSAPKGSKGSGKWKGYHPGRDDFNSFRPLNALALEPIGTLDMPPTLEKPVADDPRTTKASKQTLNAIAELEVSGFHVSEADAQAILADLRMKTQAVKDHQTAMNAIDHATKRLDAKKDTAAQITSDLSDAIEPG